MAKKTTTELVSALVPESTADVLRLQALLQRTKKGTLVRDIVKQHVADNNWSVDDGIERYASHLFSQWDLRWRETTDFRDYISMSALTLEEKYKLPRRLSKRIIELCKEQHRLHQSISK